MCNRKYAYKYWVKVITGNIFPFVFFFNFYVFRRKSKRNKEYELPPASSFFRHLCGAGLALAKAWTREPIQVSHLGGGNPGTWVTSSCIPGSASAGNWNQEQEAGIEPRLLPVEVSWAVLLWNQIVTGRFFLKLFGIWDEGGELVNRTVGIDLFF